MREIKGDILSIKEVNGKPVVGVCFTSNAIVTREGKAVMGAGVAKYFKDNFNGLDVALGKIKSRTMNNVVTDLGYWDRGEDKHRIIAFPTKNHWKNDSIPALIKMSCLRLKNLIDSDVRLQKGVILLPRPGCDNGGLDWEEIKDDVIKRLPNNVVIITKD